MYFLYRFLHGMRHLLCRHTPGGREIDLGCKVIGFNNPVIRICRKCNYPKLEEKGG